MSQTHSITLPARAVLLRIACGPLWLPTNTRLGPFCPTTAASPENCGDAVRETTDHAQRHGTAPRRPAFTSPSIHVNVGTRPLWSDVPVLCPPRVVAATPSTSHCCSCPLRSSTTLRAPSPPPHTQGTPLEWAPVASTRPCRTSFGTSAGVVCCDRVPGGRHSTAVGTSQWELQHS